MNGETLNNKENEDSKKEQNEIKKVKVGIGFATGRKNFQKILKTNVYNWQESGLTNKENTTLNVFVAYDLKYSNTIATDYTVVSKNILSLIDSTNFIGSMAIKKEIDYMIEKKIIDEREAKLFFSRGYAGKRNAVLYFAIKEKVDYLIFMDDDEYPMAVTNTRKTAIWSGQHILDTHLIHIKEADITNGHHCGYISPIPFIEFDEVLKEETFKTFIEAISNDIINWETIKKVIDNRGITYADTKVLISEEAEDVEEVNGSKFISGSNLGINLTDVKRVNPFYNPPNARGEDTFLSTCLSERRVLRIPCYAFHDGFSNYRNLMNGILPIRLKNIPGNSEEIIDRFYSACIGWVRYKPLLIYITQQENYEEKIEEMKKQIEESLPSICKYFKKEEFMNINKELEKYHRNVKKHYKEYLEIQQISKKIFAQWE